MKRDDTQKPRGQHENATRRPVHRTGNGQAERDSGGGKHELTLGAREAIA